MPFSPRIRWVVLAVVLGSWPLVAGDPERVAVTSDETAAAFARLAAGKADEAANEFARLLSEDSDNEAAAAGRVRSLLRLGLWRQALTEARELVTRTPDSKRLRGALAEALFRAGRLDEIESTVDRAIDGENPSARALALLGRLRDAEGRGGEAVGLMQRAVAADPADRDVLRWASGASATRAEAVERLERYLDLSEGDDPDRIAAARGGVAVLRALGERAIWVDELRPEQAEIPLKRLWDPRSGALQGLVIHVGLGDRRKPVPLLLDSGSPGLYVIRRVARKCGFAPLAEQSQFGGGGDREHRTTRGMFREARIGELRFSEVLASSNKQELDPTGRYHGLIGLSAFNGYRVILDLTHDRLLLAPPGESDEGDPYWTVDGQWLVRAETGHDEPGLFLFDTGATRTIVNEAIVRDLPDARLGPTVAIQGFGGTVAGARRVSGVEVRFGGVGTRGRSLSVVDLATRSRLGEIEVAGFIGLDLMGAARLEVDTVRRRVVVLPHTPAR